MFSYHEVIILHKNYEILTNWFILNLEMKNHELVGLEKTETKN